VAASKAQWRIKITKHRHHASISESVALISATMACAYRKIAQQYQRGGANVAASASKLKAHRSA
jgi:hypothetical protein